MTCVTEELIRLEWIPIFNFIVGCSDYILSKSKATIFNFIYLSIIVQKLWCLQQKTGLYP